jgi:DNA polymerase-3 subunit alpha
VTAIGRQISRRDSTEWGKITVEDFRGTATVLAFGDAWQKYKEVLQQDAVVEVVGRVSSRERDEENPPIFLDSARPLDAVAPELAVQIEIELGAGVAEDAFTQARRVIADHPGTSAVWIQVGPDNGERAPRLKSRTLRVDPGEAALGALQKLFGRGNVRLVRTASPDSDEQGPRRAPEGRRDAASRWEAG